LAYKIATGNVRDELKNKTIYELDVSLTVAGTKYRGEFEEKLKKILKKVKEDKNAIIFIDEIHNIVGAGGAEGAIDASNILKPYLARKDITCIGATTYDEYSRVIEKEKAIDRRFMTIFLDEISAKDSKEILNYLKEDYETYHGITISSQICEKIVDYLSDYVKEKKFPDKAIDVLDYACVASKYKGKNILDIEDVKDAIKELYKINLDNKNIFYLNKKLKEEIIGQDQVIDALCKNLSLIDLKEKNKPKGVYLFLGDSGIGKTELAKVLANNYFKDGAYIKINRTNKRSLVYHLILLINLTHHIYRSLLKLRSCIDCLHISIHNCTTLSNNNSIKPNALIKNRNLNILCKPALTLALSPSI
jgi:ATP-dependent Clp protease ATP-binding subunit ClpA